ncbi:DUF1206 domain-containing protein [Pseudoclavibacter chungangensis]|uniref:DUF1206 domain-containing protein n=1 Tax=Pseudoclavibacter chungangensis TaxID=587635 RepID=A0A7J5BTL7_9MICO|nr:DUF1206 domain-containing protein [Pseudoclavibacter chungangensis]KAB1656826.1 DUF1206 domain-containing protein [Pseudoclavibacter chungangensis]NYJ67279.1 hypothetical protein [Pseudoclavibacter chungangensis]
MASGPRNGYAAVNAAADRLLDGVGDAAKKLVDRPAFRAVARAGFVVAGLVNVLIGVLAMQLALGGGATRPDQAGAVELVELVPGGTVLLVVCLLAIAMLMLWLLLDGLAERSRRGGSEGARAFGKRVGVLLVYGAVALTIQRALSGSSSDTEQTADSASTSIIGTWWGASLIVIVGLVIAGVGVYAIAVGVRRTFTKTLDLAGSGPARHLVVGAGVVGHVARGLAFIVMGALCVIAVVTRDPETVGGLGGTLQTIAEQPFGPWLLTAVGVGLCAYGLFLALRARFEDLDRTV